VKVPFLIIGGGLSGLAAGIRYARFSQDVLILEQHNRVGGLNSYYHRKKILLETGLHAITNFAPAKEKKAPLNRLFRQLKINRKNFDIYPQISSEIHFSGKESLTFSNDFAVLSEDIRKKFPNNHNSFLKLVSEINGYDPFTPRSFISAQSFIHERLNNSLLTEMLLCPLMYYGSSVENDMDLGQFVIMFRSIFQEGMFRPAGSIKDFLDGLVKHYSELGGTLKLSCKVKKIISSGKKAKGVELDSGELITCDNLLSTIGYTETCHLLSKKTEQRDKPRLGFVENIFLFNKKQSPPPSERTIIFFNSAPSFKYQRPALPTDFNSGVICFPENFTGRTVNTDYFELRSTHLANYHKWKELNSNREVYLKHKLSVADESLNTVKKIIGNFPGEILFQDTFTPITVQRYTSKKEGAIYGSPYKIKDGNIGYSNVFLAGTDQGFLGIVGSMLSGVSIVNQHILPKI